MLKMFCFLSDSSRVRVSVFATALRFGVFESVPTVSREVHGVRFLGGECLNLTKAGPVPSSCPAQLWIGQVTHARVAAALA